MDNNTMRDIAQFISTNGNTSIGDGTTLALVILMFFAFLMFTYGLPIEAGFIIAIPLFFIMVTSGGGLGIGTLAAIALVGGLFIYLAIIKAMHK